jgi:NAD-dependent deacetylase
MDLPDNPLDALERAAQALAVARRLLVLTGAGISAESGVPTFRGPGGLWRSHRPEDLATPQAFRRDPQLVWEWYRLRQQKVRSCEPNPGHLALALLGEAFDHQALITQNVDGLHTRAGSQRILELHGNLFRARCMREQTVRDFEAGDLLPPTCSCGALLRPHIVWFGEPLDRLVLAEAFAEAETCDVCLVVGTSGLVSPAADLPIFVARRGVKVIELNLEATPLSSHAWLSLHGSSGTLLPRLVNRTLVLKQVCAQTTSSAKPDPT